MPLSNCALRFCHNGRHCDTSASRQLYANKIGPQRSTGHRVLLCLLNTMANRTNRRELAQSNAKTKRFTLAIAVWFYSNRLFINHFLSFSFVASNLQMNLSTLWKINGDAVNNLDGFVWNRLLPAEVSILVVLSSHLRAAVNNLSEQVEAKMHRHQQLRLQEAKFMYRWGEALCSLLHFCASCNCCLWWARFEEWVTTEKELSSHKKIGEEYTVYRLLIRIHLDFSRKNFFQTLNT